MAELLISDSKNEPQIKQTNNHIGAHSQPQGFKIQKDVAMYAIFFDDELCNYFIFYIKMILIKHIPSVIHTRQFYCVKKQIHVAARLYIKICILCLFFQELAHFWKTIQNKKKIKHKSLKGFASVPTALTYSCVYYFCARNHTIDTLLSRITDCLK